MHHLASAPDRHAHRSVAIDMLRGLSIVIVVCHHLSLRIPLAHTAFGWLLPRGIVMVLAWGGDDAVAMFFAMSGFLITRRAAGARGFAAVRPAAFLLHRAARILPLLLLLIIMLGVVSRSGFADYTFRPGQSWMAATFAVLTCWFNLYEARTGWPPANWDVLWSLSIEEAFYLAFPLLCMMPALPCLLILSGLVVVGPIDWHFLQDSSEIWREKAYLPGFCAIASGVLAAWTTFVAPRPGRAVAGVLIVIGALAASLELFDIITVGDAGLALLAGGTALILTGFHALPASPHAGRAVAPLRWLRDCGRNSYEIYLSHMFVVLPAVNLWRLAGLSDGAGAVLFPAVLLLSAKLGAGIVDHVSRPITRWLDSRLVPAGQNPNM